VFGQEAMNGRVAGETAGCASLGLSFCAEADSVPCARRAVAEWASSNGAIGSDLDRIRLAVSEAVTNAVVHAYTAERRGVVRVSAGLGAGELTVLVADEGCGIGAAPESPGLGLGLGVIDECADVLTITTGAAGGIQLEMRFRLERCGERRFRERSAQVRGSVVADGRNAASSQARGSVVSAMRAAWPRFSTNR
jgi:anti-sigma regulatory factor (Ser/Thr protein kinase)